MSWVSPSITCTPVPDQTQTLVESVCLNSSYLIPQLGGDWGVYGHAGMETLLIIWYKYQLWPLVIMACLT